MKIKGYMSSLYNANIDILVDNKKIDVMGKGADYYYKIYITPKNDNEQFIKKYTMNHDFVVNEKKKNDKGFRIIESHKFTKGDSFVIYKDYAEIVKQGDMK